MAETLDIGTLSGRIELEDRMSNILTLTEKALAQFEETEKKAGEGGESMAAGVFKGELALDALKKAGELAVEGVEKVFDMMIEGGKILDVKDSFIRMTGEMGIAGEDMAVHVGEALHGTVHDMDIMQRANANMAAGLALTDEQMTSLAKGAWALGKAMGIDAGDAMDRLSMAMVTGRTRGIALLTGKIDLTDAEQKFAKSLGTTTDHLTAEGKMESTRQAILEKVAASTERIGETTLRTGDKYTQIKVQWEEFWESVSVSLEQSPVMTAMVDSFGAAWKSAFGGSQAAIAENFVRVVETIAIGLMDLARDGVAAGGFLVGEYSAVKVVFGDLLQVIDGVRLAGLLLNEVLVGIDAKAGIGGAVEEYNRLDKKIADLEVTMLARGKSLQEDKAAEEEWGKATNKVQEAIEGVRQKMIESQKAAGEHRKAIEGNTAATEEGAKAAEAGARATEAMNTQLATAIQYGLKSGVSMKELAVEYGITTNRVLELSTAVAKSGFVMEKTPEQVAALAKATAELKSVTTDYHETVAKMDATLVATIKHYLDAGVSQATLATVYTLTAAQMSAVNKERQAELQAMKIEEEATISLAKSWIKFDTDKALLTATDTEKSRLVHEEEYKLAVEEGEKKHLVDVKYYEGKAALRDAGVIKDDLARLLGDDRTLASLELRVKKDRDTYQFMLQHGRDYTDAVITQQAELVTAGEKRIEQWGREGDQIDADASKVKGMTQEVQRLAGAMDKLYEKTVSDLQAANVSQAGGSWAVTKDTFAESMQASHAGVSMELASAMAELGYSYGEIIGYRALESDNRMRFAANKKLALQKLINEGQLAAPQGPRIPGFSEGTGDTYVDFGIGTLALLHGKEKITALGGPGGTPGTGGGGTMTNHFYVNGTAADVARQISAEIMRNLASTRQFSFGN